MPYQRLTNGQILTRDQLQSRLDNMKARTGGGDWTLDQLLDKFSAGNGARPSGWNRGMTDGEVAALGAPDMGQFFDVAGDDYQTPEGGFGDGRGDAGYHYGFKANPDGTYTILDDGDYSGSFKGQQADRRSTFNLGEFGVKAGLLASLGMMAPGLSAAFGGGVTGGALGGAVGGMGGAIATDSDIGKGALFGGLAGGLNGFAGGLEGGRNFVGPMPDSVLPSTSQLVGSAGRAGIGMLGGQSPTQALTGSALNLTGITGNNALKDLGLDPKLAGLVANAGTGLLGGRDPTSIALSSLPALGSYAGSLFGSGVGNNQQFNNGGTANTVSNNSQISDASPYGQSMADGTNWGTTSGNDLSWLDSLTANLSNSADGSYASPMTGGDAPNNTGANSMWEQDADGNWIWVPQNQASYEDMLGGMLPSASGSNFDPGEFNMSDYLPADLGQMGATGTMPGTDVSWQSVLDQIPGFGQNAVDPTSLGGYGNTANANSGSGISGLLGQLLGTGAAGALGTAGGSMLGSLGSAGLGALLGSINGSKQSGTNVTTTEPWSAQQPYLKDLFAKAQTTFNGQPSINPLQTQALSEAGANSDPTANWFGSGGKVGTNAYAGMENPYLQQSIDYANEDVNRAMMPMLNKANRASGSFGNSGVAEYYSRSMADQFGRNANTARMNNYNQQLGISENDVNRRFQGAMNAPTLQNQTLQNANNKFNLGTMAQAQPYDALKNYQSLITGGYGNSSSSPIYTNPIGGLLNGAGIGASIYKSIFPNGGK